ncbi:MAG: hypothetical protein J7K65_03240 [Planctomycetes bacterium]|nr:hypothetical protein [Planctomycetota bacterium]
MDYLATVRDGSTGQLVNGYRLSGGLKEAINTCFWFHKDLLRKSLRENP